MVYAIGLESTYSNGQRMVKSRPDRGLKRLAEETGGGYFELKRATDLAPTFTKVAPIDLRHEIAQKCDVVIEALAD